MGRLREIIKYWKSHGFISSVAKIINKFLLLMRYWKVNGFKASIKKLKNKFFGGNRLDPSEPRFNIPENTTSTGLLKEKFRAIQPLRIFRVPKSDRRLNLVTDSINSGSLFGGVATALTFSALLAGRWKCDLRIITRTESARKQNFDQLMKLNGISWSKNIDFLFADFSNPKVELPVGDDEVFLTTSWWTTQSVLGTFTGRQIIYLLQEDERAFYPLGDEQLRCTNVFKNSDIKFIINTKLLYEHFVLESFNNIKNNGLWFEPSFTENLFFYDDQTEKKKRNFFFYARPNNFRNLFYLGLEVIDMAISKGILDPNQWNLFFVGKDLPNIKIFNSYIPTIVQNLSLEEYGKLAQKMDLGLCLMYSPHPSYPPLDLAACGAVVVTNQFGNKQNLDQYSSNIICRSLDVNSLTEGLADAVELALDYDKRIMNFQKNGLLKDWKVSFEDVLAHLERWPE
jgi:O-antigen biosynthesis protein